VYESGKWEIDLAQRALRARGVPVPIGDLAFEIIEILVQAAGKLVAKNDLMDRVWPGAIVEDNTLQFHVSTIRKALGPDREMLKTAAGRGYQLLGNWTLISETRSVGLARTAQASTAARPSVSNLPLAASELIGRAGDMRDIRDLMSAYRVVTLTGLGGSGKTKLALEVARALTPELSGDSCLVELAPLSDPRLVPSAVALALGLESGGGEISPEAVARLIGGRKLLLVLDNCEHVIDVAARVVEAIVRDCPHTSVLATSREALFLEAECVHKVSPLEVPPEAVWRPEDLSSYSAVQLFITKMDLVGSSFSPVRHDLPVIASICRRLDGMPLAIELAAARAATLGPEQVASRMDDRFGLLTGGRRTALPRHRTLRATIDWSYDLLSEAERVILPRLAVFAGGFTLEAAIAVLATPEAATLDIADGISGLVTKSLVVMEQAAYPIRYLLLETVRAYAFDKLAEAAELEFTRARHARFFHDLFEGAEAAWRMRPNDWLASWRREIDNVRTALDWGLSTEGDARIAVSLTASSIRLMGDLSLIAECRRHAERAITAIYSGARVDTRCEMHLLTAKQWTTVYIDGPSIEGYQTWQRILELATRLDDVDYQTRALWGLWNDHAYAGHAAEALVFARRYENLSVPTGEARRVVFARRVTGIALHYSGEQEAARLRLEYVLRYYEHGTVPPALGTQINHATVTRATLARILWIQGFPDQALQLADQALREAIADDHPMAIQYVLIEASIPLSFFSGDLEATRRLLDTLAEQASRSDFRIWQTYARCFQAMLLAGGGGGMPMFIEAVGELREIRYCAHLTMFLAALAEIQGAARKIADGIQTIDSALDWCESTGERWFIAEILRIKSDLLVLRGEHAEAESYLRQAQNWSREQSALSWELRTSVSLARLHHDRGWTSEARGLLQPVYDRFSEGFETADLKSAKAYLNLLQ
jgi:predicted ATPase/DNA-binding winged helix-turn-helix (wHTH) protein